MQKKSDKFKTYNSSIILVWKIDFSTKYPDIYRNI